jgi:glycosyltransferase involved in cell wall biosynthesis
MHSGEVEALELPHERRPTTASIVLPVHNQAAHIEDVVDGHLRALARHLSDLQCEVILVLNACVDDSAAVCRRIVAERDNVRIIELAEAGWGRAVKAGLREARGELLCYTNSARTTPNMLTLILFYALAYPGVVIKANRRVRDSRTRRLGSLLYNLECRALFDLAVWDVNGTPKAFHRSLDKLLALESDDDLIDAEFNLVCRREGYQVAEVPLLETKRVSGRSTTSLASAMRLYVGVFRMWRSNRSTADIAAAG